MPPLDREAWSGAIENSVALVHPEFGPSHRNGFTAVRSGVSVTSAHWVRTDEDHGPDHGSGRGGSVVEGPRLVVGSVLRGSHEVRAVVIEGEVDPSWRLEFSGWPLSADEPPLDTLEGNKAKVTSNGLVSCVASSNVFEYAVRRLTDASPSGTHTAIPCARVQPEAGVLYLAVVGLGRPPDQAPHVSGEGRAVRVEWEDGWVDYLRLDT